MVGIIVESFDLLEIPSPHLNHVPPLIFADLDQIGVLLLFGHLREKCLRALERREDSKEEQTDDEQSEANHCLKPVILLNKFKIGKVKHIMRLNLQIDNRSVCSLIP